MGRRRQPLAAWALAGGAALACWHSRGAAPGLRTHQGADGRQGGPAAFVPAFQTAAEHVVGRDAALAVLAVKVDTEQALGGSSELLGLAATSGAAEPGLVFGGYAPAIFGLLAAATSLAQLWEASQPRLAGGAEGFFGSDRWVGRTFGISFVWAALAYYSFTCAPGFNPAGQLADKAMVETLLATPFDGTVSPFFVGIFNALGLWPLIYAATLLPGSRNQSPVPALPFVAGSFFLGAFALSPYLALRQLRGLAGAERRSNLDFFTRYLLESPLTGLLAFAGGAYLALYALGNGNLAAASPASAATAWEGLQGPFRTQMLVHVSCIDFCVLWGFFGPVLLEDGQRRGKFVRWTDDERSLFAACWAVPVLGPAAWLLLRPPLEE